MKLKVRHRTRQALFGYAFIGLWIIGFFVFTLYPLIQTFLLSLNNVRVSTSGILTDPVGFQNYQDAFLLDVNWGRMLIDYVLQTAISVPIIIVFSLVIAMMLNEGFRGRGVLRTIFFLPVIITSGPVIEKLMDQGSTTLPGLTDLAQSEDIIPGPAIIVSLFQYLMSSFIVLLWFTGVQILIFLAGLQQMSGSVYEAAKIDGASRWEIFWKITLPALRGMIVLNVVYTIVSLSLFTLNPVIVKIAGTTFDPSQGGIGYASALSWIYFAVMVIILAIFVRIFAGRRDR